MSELRMIPVDQVMPNPEQPRVVFDEIEIASLAESIREEGLIQPITVEEHGDGYLLIDGERRLRAMKMLGKPLIEAKVILFSDEKSSDKLSQAVVANMQRADLNPIEEGRAINEMRERGMTLEAISRLVGRSVSHISFRGELLDWELINQAATETCEHCDLNDIASAQMCKDCSAVELLKRLNRIIITQMEE